MTILLVCSLKPSVKLAFGFLTFYGGNSHQVLALDADTSVSDIASPFKLVADFQPYRNYAYVAGYDKIQILHITVI
jgi:hypothetical protein